MRHLILTGIVKLLLLFCLPAAAQDFVFNRLSEKDGLASKFVKAIWQDPKGFLWVGTDNGLQRYDGKSFFSAHKIRSSNLPFAPVSQLLYDRQKRLWVRFGSQLGVYDPGSFRYRAAQINSSTNNPGGEPPVLKMDVKGRLYLLPKTMRPQYLDETSFSFDEKNNPYKMPDHWSVTASFEDTVHQRSWFGVSGRLICYDWKTAEFSTPKTNAVNSPLIAGASGARITSISVDARRRYWLSFVKDGKIDFACYDEAAGKFTEDTAGLSGARSKGFYDLYDVMYSSDGLTIAAGLNMFQLRINGRFANVEDHTPAGSMVYEKISQVFEDREGIIWVASDNGLYNLTPGSRRNKRLFFPTGSKTLLNTLAQHPDGRIFINNYQQGIDQYDESLNLVKQHFIRLNHPDQAFNNVWCMTIHKATNTLWLGCEFGRLIIYHFDSGKTEYLQPKSFVANTPTRMLTDNKGAIWIAIASGELLRWKPGAGFGDDRFETVNNTAVPVAEMSFHTDGNLYACTRGRGVQVISGENGKTVYQMSTNATRKISSDMIGDVGTVNDSTLCFVGDGLIVMNTRTGATRTISQHGDELIGDMILGLPDNYGDYWFVSTNGIFRYTASNDNLRKFSEWEGLASPNSVLSVVDRYRLRNGRILMVGATTAFMYDPKNYRSDERPRDVLISDLSVNNQFLPLDSVLSLARIHLSKDQNSIAVSFGVPVFGKPNKNFYSYKLVNADKDWINAGNQQEARYSGLAPGSYTFMVRAQNEMGEYSANTTSLQFVIHPPFWKTWWFIACMILLIALIIYQVHKLRVEQLLKVERVRTRLARDLHDDMGSTLSSINLLSTVALKKVGKSDEDVHAHLKKIGQSSGRVMEAMDDIVWSINPANDNMTKITARMREYLGNTLEAKDIAYNFDVPDTVKELSFKMEQRRDIFLIFKEVINNVIKYAEATKVDINMEFDRKLFSMIIADNGKGFDPDAPLKETRGNGTRNMQARAEAIGGKLTIKSSIGEGTKVELSIPRQ